MRVGLDLQLATGTATGIGEYANGLRGALIARGVDVVTLSSPRFDPWRFDRRVAWDQVLLPLAARRARVDLVHCASGTMPLLLGLPVVTTVHDVAWLRVQAHARPYARAYFGAFSLALYRNAARILVDSAFSRDELLAVAALDPARVDVVYPGVARDVMDVVRARDAGEPFVLVVGTVEPRKNLEVVLRALAEVPRLRLVSIGPPTPYRERCLELARRLEVEDRVDIRGYVPRATVLALYARALAAAVPSTYEGFGYAAAQALCAGVPLVAANTSSLPEVAGDAAALDPHDVTGWAAALAAIVADPDAADRRAAERRAAAAARFGWEVAA
ncbi:MAG: glycosyltransferase family 4 protein, partial [Candidatus Eremiobacteraeota bacterium]|nr:glycosyltransferase family 4 protein [Candidatus Eremiobacteraeota bacterium]